MLDVLTRDALRQGRGVAALVEDDQGAGAQARPDRFMAAAAARLMVYEGLLLQALSKLPEYSREGALLPAIVPIVLLMGRSGGICRCASRGSLRS